VGGGEILSIMLSRLGIGEVAVHLEPESFAEVVAENDGPALVALIGGIEPGDIVIDKDGTLHVYMPETASPVKAATALGVAALVKKIGLYATFEVIISSKCGKIHYSHVQKTIGYAVSATIIPTRALSSILSSILLSELGESELGDIVLDSARKEGLESVRLLEEAEAPEPLRAWVAEAVEELWLTGRGPLAVKLEKFREKPRTVTAATFYHAYAALGIRKEAVSGFRVEPLGPTLARAIYTFNFHIPCQER